ncbi:MAG: hypothetical protein DHS20C12_27000 [Pseudohongiella sp.]|nr:MAG: hypothetical protein DHS20C12_27000 [Pseudohongiella sp.]
MVSTPSLDGTAALDVRASSVLARSHGATIATGLTLDFSSGPFLPRLPLQHITPMSGGWSATHAARTPIGSDTAVAAAIIRRRAITSKHWRYRAFSIRLDTATPPGIASAIVRLPICRVSIIVIARTIVT